MSFNPYAFFTQPLLLTLGQMFGVIPPSEIPTAPITNNGESLSTTQKAALAALGIATGGAVAGAAIIADKLSNQRITIIELDHEPESTFEKIEEVVKRNKKGLKSIAALGLFGAILGASLLPGEKIEEPPKIPESIAPLATGQWFTPTATTSAAAGGYSSGYVFAEP